MIRQTYSQTSKQVSLIKVIKTDNIIMKMKSFKKPLITKIQIVNNYQFIEIILKK